MTRTTKRAIQLRLALLAFPAIVACGTPDTLARDDVVMFVLSSTSANGYSGSFVVGRAEGGNEAVRHGHGRKALGAGAADKLHEWVRQSDSLQALRPEVVMSLYETTIGGGAEPLRSWSRSDGETACVEFRSERGSKQLVFCSFYHEPGDSRIGGGESAMADHLPCDLGVREEIATGRIGIRCHDHDAWICYFEVPDQNDIRWATPTHRALQAYAVHSGLAVSRDTKVEAR